MRPTSPPGAVRARFPTGRPLGPRGVAFGWSGQTVGLLAPRLAEPTFGANRADARANSSTTTPRTTNAVTPTERTERRDRRNDAVDPSTGSIYRCRKGRYRSGGPSAPRAIFTISQTHAIVDQGLASCHSSRVLRHGCAGPCRAPVRRLTGPTLDGGVGFHDLLTSPPAGTSRARRGQAEPWLHRTH